MLCHLHYEDATYSMRAREPRGYSRFNVRRKITLPTDSLKFVVYSMSQTIDRHAVDCDFLRNIAERISSVRLSGTVEVQITWSWRTRRVHVLAVGTCKVLRRFPPN
jgi:hypothetical protein